MTSRQMAAARNAKLRRINKFYKNQELVQDFLEIYKDYNQDETINEFNLYKNKLSKVTLFGALGLLLGTGIFFSAFAFIGSGDNDPDYKSVGICLGVGAFIWIASSFLFVNYDTYKNTKNYLEFKIDSFDEGIDYSLEDIKELKSYKLSKFSQIPPPIDSKYDFLCGVYAVHCLNLPYSKEGRLPVLFMSGIGFRYDASCTANKIKSDWKKYKKNSDYDTFYKHMFDHIIKYKININSIQFTFIENIEEDIDETPFYWHDKFAPNDNSWY